MRTHTSHPVVRHESHMSFLTILSFAMALPLVLILVQVIAATVRRILAPPLHADPTTLPIVVVVLP